MAIKKNELESNDNYVLDLNVKPAQIGEDHYQAFVDIKLQHLTCSFCGNVYPRLIIDDQVVFGGIVTSKVGKQIVDHCGCKSPF